jgi:hypothetical protein
MLPGACITVTCSYAEHRCSRSVPGSPGRFPVILDAADAYVVDTLSVSAYRMGEAIERLDDLISGQRAEGEIDLDDL